MKGLKRTIEFQGVVGVPKEYGKLQIENDFCVHCLRGKQVKCKHVKVNRHVREIGVLVHMDTQEMPTQSWNGKKHTLTMVEHISGVDSPAFIAKKSDVSVNAVNMLRWLRTQTGNKCKELQVDGAGEFIGPNTELRKYCARKGIIYRISIRYTPQSNGVAEAMNKKRQYCSLTIREENQVSEEVAQLVGEQLDIDYGPAPGEEENSDQE
jgi:hypothetical protein